MTGSKDGFGAVRDRVIEYPQMVFSPNNDRSAGKRGDEVTEVPVTGFPVRP